MPTEHFKSKEAYKKFNAYTHMHGIKTHIKTAVIAGHPHKVEHSGLHASAVQASKRKAQVKSFQGKQAGHG